MLFLYLRYQFEAQRSAGALVTVDGRSHEHQIRSQHLFDGGERNGGGLVNHQQIGSIQQMRIIRRYELNCLTAVPRYIDANDGLFVVSIGRPNDCVVGMLLVFQCIEATQHEFEECDQIFGMRRRDVDVYIAKGDGS